MTNNTHHSERFEELCAAYVLNALEADERSEFETLLEGASEEEMQLYYALQSAANQMAFTAPRVQPPEAVINQILKKVKSGAPAAEAAAASDPPTSGKDQGFSRAMLAMAASFALLLITLALVFYSFNLNTQLNNQEEIIANQQAQITELRNNVHRKEEMLSILEARTIDMIIMSGMEVNPDGYGKVIWDPEKQQALLQVANLPAVPAGKDYQLWLIKNNKPIPSGVFAVNDPSKDSFFKIEHLADADKQSANAFAITLEPEGGVQQPTGKMYLLGNVRPNTN